MIPVIPVALPGQSAATAASVADTAAVAAALQQDGPGRDRPGIWLHAAAAGLGVLAGAAAAVSFTAQYRLVYAARHLAAAAGLEAAIPDAAALVFACLGVALALHGRRALRARALNAASAGASVVMNVIAAAPGWRDMAVWAMPPAAYALASDTLIGVLRTSVLPRQGAGALAGEVTLLAVLGGVALWLLRLTLAPASTLAGFRAWVLEECPVAPGRRASRLDSRNAGLAQDTRVALPAPSAGSPGAAFRDVAAPSRGTGGPLRGSGPRDGTKTARFLALVAERHGPLAAVPLDSVSRLSAELAPEAGLNTGSARAALRRAVLAARDGVAR
jgi:hypothetical protein